MKPKVLIVYESRGTDSMLRYAQDLLRASSGRSRLMSLRPSRAHTAAEGSVELKSNFYDWPLAEWISFVAPPSVAYSHLSKLPQTEGLQSTILHYAAGYIRPLRSSRADLVTIHDLNRLTFRDDSDLLRTAYMSRVMRQYSRFRHILTDSRTMKEEIDTLSWNASTSFVYPPIAPDFHPLGEPGPLRRDLGLPLDKHLVLSISNRQVRKNLGVVEAAMKSLGPDYRLVRVGPGVGDSINFTGVSEATLNRLYNACDVLLYPSLYEGFGYVAAEACAAGLPVVASDIDIFREVLSGAAILRPPHDANAMAAGVKEAVAAHDELRKKGLELAGRYTFSAFSEALCSFYDRISS